MAKRSNPWQSGRRAWQRLEAWSGDHQGAPGHPDDGAAALEALGDVWHLRNLLDQAELVAVRTARRHGRSWAEIATRLGVSRQSAWERWRDLDDTPQPEPDAISAAVPDLVEDAARQLRRRSTVVVPKVVGLSWNDARKAIQDAALFATGPDPDGPPLSAVGWPDGVVVDQAPEAGAKVPTGSRVTLWIDRNGGFGGVREPRRPKPGPRLAREQLVEPSDEAVG